MSVGTSDSRVASTGDQLTRAREIAEVAIDRYENDNDRDRSDDEWRADVFEGARTEVAAEQYFRERGFDARIVDDDEEQAHDLVVEGLTVEVKLRRLWNRQDPDLLLRYDDNPDIYVMVEARRTPTGKIFEVTKWASQTTVEENKIPFRPNRPQVEREHLDDIETLPPILKLFREEGDRR